MNLQDRIMEWLLAAFDRCMDFVTFGMWTEIRGDVTWQSKIKIKKERV